MVTIEKQIWASEFDLALFKACDVFVKVFRI